MGQHNTNGCIQIQASQQFQFLDRQAMFMHLEGVLFMPISNPEEPDETPSNQWTTYCTFAPMF
jgi:hypothetical protein